MAAMTDHRSLADSLSKALHLAVAPIGISFGDEAPAGVPAFDEPMSEPAADGRAGRVPAGCVFWVRAAERSFTTAPEDHGNCSVGRYTHGLASLEDVGRQRRRGRPARVGLGGRRGRRRRSRRSRSAPR